MLIVHVDVQVKQEFVGDFIEATRRNAAASLLEPGVVRFDVIQRAEDATRFLLVEVYRDGEAPKKHKESVHYLSWRDDVEKMMARPRESQKFNALFPEAARWETRG